MGDSSFASGFKTGFGSAFLQFSLERFATIGSLAWREIGLIWGVDDELRKLQRTFLKIQDLVGHMEGNPLRLSGGISGADGGSKAWQMWYEDMRKLAYDADGLLDHVSLHLSRNCADDNVDKQSQVFSMVLSSPSKLNLPHEICEMQNKLEELTKELESLMMIEKVKWDSCKLAPTRLTQFMNFYSTTTTFVDDENVVGRANDKEYITSLLDNDSERGNFSVISLVGMGGIGKTTLARLVYDDENVAKGFLRMWVSISMDFNVVRITRSIIESVTLSPCNLSDLYSLQMRLRRILDGEKFLLVLDDYWSDLHEDWDVLSSPFRFGSPGSKIIVTTRSTKTSSIVGSSEAYKLRILSDDDCWNLIKQRAIANVETNQNLESIGRQIANKCQGLPLVAMALGSLLHCKNSEDEWCSILESELWDMPQNTNVFPALMLSYLNLPAHLQKCFAYCSIFPQNHEFEVEELVHLWMAEGFIHPIGGRRLEDLGRDYFDDLYSRCFFQRCRSASNEEIYKMHDVIRDMARLVSQDICFHVKYSMSSCYPLFGNVCHLSLLHDNNEPMELKASLKNVRLRTFLAMGNNAAINGKVHPQLFLSLQFLRVLGLSYIGLSEVPNSIDQLTYLRYLNLSGNPFEWLPECMCKLVALQTLKLKDCNRLRQLPKDTWKLSNLRHLYLDVQGLLQWMPLQFGRLTSLQTLSLYVVGTQKGNSIKELKNMDSLRGSLCIKNIHVVSNESEAAEAMLNMKKCLDKLELQWRKLSNRLNAQVLDLRRDEQAKVLAKLEPHQNLKELVIENYCGIIYPGWLSEACRKFTSIHLQGLQYCDNLPSLGQLPLLKFFTISDMPCLVTIDDNLYGTGNNERFPLLESFQVRRMSMLVNWQNVSNGAMPRLGTFTIDDCPNLISLPQELQSRPNSNISGCPSLTMK